MDRYSSGSPNPLSDLWDAAVRGYSIKLTCRGCRRQRILDGTAMWHLFERKGWADRLRDVPGHFRCRLCDRRSPWMDLVHEQPTDNSLPLPSELEWKRQLRRRR